MKVIDGLSKPLADVLLRLLLELGIKLARDLSLQVGIETVCGTVKSTRVVVGHSRRKKKKNIKQNAPDQQPSMMVSRSKKL